jgi:hypothetical protein
MLRIQAFQFIIALLAPQCAVSHSAPGHAVPLLAPQTVVALIRHPAPQSGVTRPSSSPSPCSVSRPLAPQYGVTPVILVITSFSPGVITGISTSTPVWQVQSMRAPLGRGPHGSTVLGSASLVRSHQSSVSSSRCAVRSSQSSDTPCSVRSAWLAVRSSQSSVFSSQFGVLAHAVLRSPHSVTP